MNIEYITEIEKANKLWDELSYKQTLFDDWSFRYAFYKYNKFPIEFITITENNELIGLLPLQFNTDQKYYEFFGGSWMEDNNVYIKNGFVRYIPDLFNNIKGPAHLIGINGSDEFCKNLPIDDYKYQLDISSYSSYWDYISDKFNKKSEQTYKRKFKKIESLGPHLIINQFNDIEKLFEYNIKTFGDDSSFLFPHRKDIYRDLLNLDLNKYLLSIEINGEIEAVALNIEYNNILYYLNAGANNMNIPNLGSLIIMNSIDVGIKNQCKIFDALMYSYNWKERWHFNKIPFYKFDKN